MQGSEEFKQVFILLYSAFPEEAVELKRIGFGVKSTRTQTLPGQCKAIKSRFTCKIEIHKLIS